MINAVIAETISQFLADFKEIEGLVVQDDSPLPGGTQRILFAYQKRNYDLRIKVVEGESKTIKDRVSITIYYFGVEPYTSTLPSLIRENCSRPKMNIKAGVDFSWLYVTCEDTPLGSMIGTVFQMLQIMTKAAGVVDWATRKYRQIDTKTSGILEDQFGTGKKAVK